MFRSSVHVLKLEMADLQVGHLRFLHELESPFLNNSREPKTDDLILAALVCSMPHRDARKFLLRWYLKPFLRLWAWRTRKCNLVYEFAFFRNYLAESIETRKVKKANGGKELHTPLHQRLYLMLVEDMNHDPEEAWDVSVREAIDLWMARAEKQGALEYWSDQEIAHWEWHQEQERKWAEQQQETVTA